MAASRQLILATAIAAGGSLALAGIGIGLEPWAALWCVPLALPLLLLLPGYTVLRSVFGETFTGLQLITLASGLSMALVTMCGLLLHYVGFMTATGWASSLGFVSLAAYAVMRLRRISVLPRASDRQWPAWRPRHVMYFGAAILVAIAAILLARGEAASTRLFAFTEFWLLPDPTGNEAPYTLGITNYEREDATYDVDVMVDDRLVRKRSGIRLRDGESFITEVNLNLGRRGGRRVEAWLFKDGKHDEVYRRVWSTATAAARARTNGRISEPHSGQLQREPGSQSQEGVAQRSHDATRELDNPSPRHGLSDRAPNGEIRGKSPAHDRAQLSTPAGQR